jgi:hypothetical protein
VDLATASRALLALLLLTLGIVGLPSQGVRAQGFFEQFFGGGQLPLPVPRPYPGAGRSSADQSYGGTSSDGGTYRTLCVRLCDGYYFPISFSTVPSEFARDADKCAASCGGEARLFYHPNPGGDVEGMIDLTGMGYARLPTAFKYRKTLVAGCACHPQPWSEAGVARREDGADGQLVARRPQGDEQDTRASEQASDRPRSPASSDRVVVARPEPVSRYVLPTGPQSYFSTEPRAQFSPKRGSPGGLFR